jgi:protein SCO1/2
MKRILFVMIVLAFLISACGAGAPEFHTSLLDSKSAAEIQMQDQNGKLFQLSKQRGKVVVLAFGFTNCPNECPLTLAHIKTALEDLGGDARNVQVVMVTTDPVRDTPQALKNYLGAFNPAFIGIPGPTEELAKIWEEYSVEVLDGGETHSSATYIIDQRGNLRLVFDPETEPGDITADLKILLAE